jgi:hypothetical protein
MRLLDDTPLDPEIAASLEAIDATLAGEPVDPAHAAIAELALLLRDERPRPSADYARRLDQRVAERFAPVQPVGEDRPRRPRRWWLWTPAAGLAVAVVVAIVIVVGGGSHSAAPGASAGPNFNAVASAPADRAPHTAAKSSASGVVAPSAVRPNGAAAQSAASSASTGAVVQPPPRGRKIIQGAQLSLSTDANRIEDVAQEVFLVVGQVHGIVSNSTITATGGPTGYAQFQLSIPSGSMPQAMSALSTLRYARVASRTDTTQDVNDQYQADVAKVADDRAVRASLLKQLAAATTQGEIDSLTIRLHDIDATIASDQSTVANLQNQVNYSQVTVTVNGGVPPVPVRTSSGGFGLHQATHDAGRVLTVAAGVVLIGLAALVPIVLVTALGWWIAAAIRRRRRQQALDLL